MTTAKVITISTAIYLSVISAAIADEFRVWKDVDGRETNALFVGVEGNTVLLQKHDQKTYKVPFSRLSTQDQEYILRRAVPAKADEPERKQNVAATGNVSNPAIEIGPWIITAKSFKKQQVYEYDDGREKKEVRAEQGNSLAIVELGIQRMRKYTPDELSKVKLKEFKTTKDGETTSTSFSKLSVDMMELQPNDPFLVCRDFVMVYVGNLERKTVVIALPVVALRNSEEVAALSFSNSPGAFFPRIDEFNLTFVYKYDSRAPYLFLGMNPIEEVYDGVFSPDAQPPFREWGPRSKVLHKYYPTIFLKQK